MANVKISALPTASNFNDDDYTVIVQNNTTKKLAKENMNISYKYSTSEIVVGKWIDDKPIYRKVITVNNLTPDSVDTKTIAHSISNLDKVTCLSCIAYADNNYFDFNSHSDANTYIDNTNIYVVVNYSGIMGHVDYAYLIIDYTKTTD